MEYAYPASDRPKRWPDLRSLAKAPYRGLTAIVGDRPYLIIDADNDTYILEGEDGTTFPLAHFDLAETGNREANALIAASRLSDSPLRRGNTVGHMLVGDLYYEDGFWHVRAGTSNVILPVNDWVELFEEVNWDKNSQIQVLAEDDGTELWLLTRDGQVIHAPQSEVFSHAGLIFQNYGDEAQTVAADFYNPNSLFRAMGEIRGDTVHISSLLGSQFGNTNINALRKTALTVRNRLKGEYPQPLSLVATAAIQGKGDVEIPLTIGSGADLRERQRAEQQPAMPVSRTASLSGSFVNDQTGETVTFHETDRHGGDLSTGYDEYVEVQGDDGQTYFINPNGDVKDTNDLVVGYYQDDHNADDDRHDWGEEAYPDWTESKVADYEDSPKRCPECGSHTCQAFQEEGKDTRLKCLNCGNEFDAPLLAHGKKSGWTTVALEYPTDLGGQDQVVELCKQIAMAYGDEDRLRVLKDQLAQLLGQTPIHAGNGNPPWDPRRDEDYGGLGGSGELIPDSSPGDVIFAYTDGTIILDDGITTYNPHKAYDFFVANGDEQKAQEVAEFAQTRDDLGHEASVVSSEVLPELTEEQRAQLEKDISEFEQNGTPQGILGKLVSAVNTPWSGDKFALASFVGYLAHHYGLTQFLSSTKESFVKDSNGNDLEAGGWYTMYSNKYKVPDVVQILNLDDLRIEAAIEGDKDHMFPITISREDLDKEGYSFEPYRIVEKKMAYVSWVPGEQIGWKLARHGFNASEQRKLIDENPSGRARNIDKMDLNGTHYTTWELVKKDELDASFLWG
jgi:hypothetical protein